MNLTFIKILNQIESLLYIWILELCEKYFQKLGIRPNFGQPQEQDKTTI